MMKRRIDVEHLSDLVQQNGMPGYNMCHISEEFIHNYSQM